ncbi:MAG: alpha/beta hydrolase [Lentisphaeria bacterium]|nr:alpha/beta hydrolase [Lentisphaeria bacterium]
MKALFPAGLIFTAVLLLAFPASAGPADYQVEKDIPYYAEGFKMGGDAEYAAERCKLDLYIPKKPARQMPVLIHFHGGGMTRGNKGFPKYQIPLAAEFILVAPNYRLSGARAKCPDYIEDAAAAAAWVVRNIAKYGGDPELIFVTGHSAGGYLSAMIGLDPRWLAPHGLDPRKCFAGVLPVSGQMSTHFNIMKERGLEGKTVIDEYAPIYHASADTPPIVLFCGQHDIEFKARVAENEFFHAVLTQLKKHPDARIHQINGFNHSTVAYPAAFLIRSEMKRIIRQKKAKQPAPEPAAAPVGAGR